MTDEQYASFDKAWTKIKKGGGDKRRRIAEPQGEETEPTSAAPPPQEEETEPTSAAPPDETIDVEVLWKEA